MCASRCVREAIVSMRTYALLYRSTPPSEFLLASLSLSHSVHDSLPVFLGFCFGFCLCFCVCFCFWLCICIRLCYALMTQLCTALVLPLTLRARLQHLAVKVEPAAATPAQLGLTRFDSSRLNAFSFHLARLFCQHRISTLLLNEALVPSMQNPPSKQPNLNLCVLTLLLYFLA